mgnify:FL=1
MIDIMEALLAFWNQFGVPAYAEDMVPDGAKLPYIRYSVAKAPAMDATIMTAYNYHNARLMGNVERARLAEQIAEAIPEKGVKLPMDNGGFLVLYRNRDFQTPYKGSEDLNVIGVRTSVEVRFYSM